MTSFFKRMFGAQTAKPFREKRFTADFSPDRAFFAVGDVHGCFDQMQRILEKIAVLDPNAPVVFVGDYVDRGEQSAAVLQALFARRDEPNLICLRGNHEVMMLQFLTAPEGNGKRWLRYGGLQTLASFGVGRGCTAESSGAVLCGAAEDLRAAIGPDMLEWLNNLPSFWQSGNIAVVHAAADPHLPMSLQVEKTLNWGHPDFKKVLRQDGVWILHGHTIVDSAYAKDGRIAIDTGAYATGQMTAAHVTSGRVKFISLKDT